MKMKEIVTLYFLHLKKKKERKGEKKEYPVV